MRDQEYLTPPQARLAAQAQNFEQIGAVAGAQSAAGQSSPSPFDLACNRLAQLICFAAALAEKLEDTDSVLNGGGNAKTETQNQPRPVPNGKLMALSMGVEELEARLSRADAASNRIRAAI